MLLSVIMPVFNESLKELNESINSILIQTFKNFEYIIIDDNPKSSSIKNFLLKKSKSDDRIKLLFNKTNIGPSNSTNKGIKYSKGFFVARMDADDISVRTRFSNQICFLNKYHLDLGCFNFSLISDNGKLIKRNCYSDISQINQDRIKNVMSYCSITNGPSFMFRRTLFDNIGGYRTKWIEDYDFASRALVGGYRVGYQSESYIYKRFRKNSVSNSGILKQFKGLCIISQYLRKYHFTKDVPISVINKHFNSVRLVDIHKFHLIKLDLMAFRKKKRLKSLIKFLFIVLSSSLIFKFYVWSKLLGSKSSQERLMKRYLL